LRSKRNKLTKSIRLCLSQLNLKKTEKDHNLRLLLSSRNNLTQLSLKRIDLTKSNCNLLRRRRNSLIKSKRTFRLIKVLSL
jgi:hypothetical protein